MSLLYRMKLGLRMVMAKHPLIRRQTLGTNLFDLFQKLKLFDIIVPLDSEPVGYWFQTLPHFLWAATDNPLPLITAGEKGQGHGQESS